MSLDYRAAGVAVAFERRGIALIELIASAQQAETGLFGTGRNWGWSSFGVPVVKWTSIRTILCILIPTFCIVFDRVLSLFMQLLAHL